MFGFFSDDALVFCQDLPVNVVVFFEAFVLKFRRPGQFVYLTKIRVSLVGKIWWMLGSIDPSIHSGR